MPAASSGNWSDVDSPPVRGAEPLNTTLAKPASVASWKKYVTAPAGPVTAVLRTTSAGLRFAVVASPTGDIGTGGSMITGMTTLNIAPFENDPVFAPSSARTRQ